MFQFFTEEFAGIPAQALNWIALGAGILIALLLLFLVFKLLRGSKLGSNRRGRHARLAVTDAASIGDDRRKLVLIRRDNVEHLLLIGGANDLVIESDIIRTAPQKTATRTSLSANSATAPIPNISEPATSRIEPTIVPPPKDIPETPAAATSTTPTPAPVSTRSAPPILTPNPTPPKIVASTATAGTTITSTSASKDGVDSGLATSQSSRIKITKAREELTSDSAPKAGIVDRRSTQKADVAARAELSKTVGSVEDMDALLSKKTTKN